MADVSRESADLFTPGVRMLANEAYHAGPGVSKSHLDLIAQSPRHYWAAYIDPDREPRKVTPALVLGSAIHAAVLEPHEFARHYVAEPKDINKRTKDGKAEYEAFLADHPGYTVLTTEQMQQVNGCAGAALRHPEVAELLKAGHAELSFYARDGDTNELIKCRTDWLDYDRGLIVDLKTTEDASPRAFQRSVLAYRYHVQVAWYRAVIAGAVDIRLPRWVFIALEKSPPYAVGIYRLSDEFIAAGQALARRDLIKLSTCRMLDQWDDYGARGEVELDLPGYARRDAGLDTAEAAFGGLDSDG